MRISWPTLFPALLAFLLYLPSIAFDFALDDQFQILENPALTSIADSLRTPLYPGTLYRPITQLSYALEIRFGVGSAAEMHLVNIALHALATLLVTLLLRRLLGLRVGLLTGLLFAMHPLHTEVVANISGRSELLSAVFVLGALLVSSSVTLSLRIVAPCLILFGLLAGGAKESGAVLPLLVLLCGYQRTASLRPHLAASFASLLGVLLYLLVRVLVLGELTIAREAIHFVDNPLVAQSGFQRALLGLTLLGKYLCLHAMPLQLSADYSYSHLLPPTLGGSSLEWASYAVLLAATLVLSLNRHSQYTQTRFAIAWFLLAFLPTSNIFFPIGTIFAERLSYLPGIGIFALFAIAFTQLRNKVFWYAACAVYLFQFALRLPDWHDNRSLHLSQLSISPASAKTQINAAAVLRLEEDYQQAYQHLQRALSIYPSYDSARFGLALLFAERGVRSRTEYWLRATLEVNPEHAAAKKMLAKLSAVRETGP
jgi:tetratricopeptide (TPR) repeat protein